MPKYLVTGGYSPEGLQGLIKDKASGRKAALQAAVKGLGGKLESFYYAFGPDDIVLILEAPDNASAASLAVSARATGLVDVSITPLLTVAEMDEALEKPAKYRAPGEGK